MELKKFVKEALLSVIEGVEEANLRHKRYKIIGVKRNDGGLDGNFIDFDVSIVVKEKSTRNRGGKIGIPILNVFSFDLNSKFDKIDSHQNVNRLKFKVWISENEM